MCSRLGAGWLAPRMVPWEFEHRRARGNGMRWSLDHRRAAVIRPWAVSA